ncbi:MAG TPA: hypothetical protein VFC15_14030 [Candidatus Limnocylindrales bacterium]|nr:hypothetical protein [Candidatus Limnocylindrales bacterium]
MKDNVKSYISPAQTPESSLVNMLSGWAQQGVENFFAAQRMLVDLAMNQNATAINLVRERVENPKFSPVSILTELASEGMSNFIAGQKVLLDLVHQENEIVLNGVRGRVSGSDAAVAMSDLVRRSLNTFVELQQDFLKIAGKQTHNWLTAVEKGKAYDGEQLVEMAREGMDHFVQTQQKFLNMIAEEASKATKSEAGRKAKVEELSELARQSSECFMEAQKKLMDVTGKQMSASLKASGRALEMVKPLVAIPIPEMAREGVRSFVDTEKALIETMTKRPAGHKVTARKGHSTKRTARTIKPEVVHA